MVTHELHAAPFHVDRPWYAVDDLVDPDFIGSVIVLASDGSEHEAERVDDGVIRHGPLPPGTSITHWRLP